jgi:hypothetical protein
MTDEGTLIARKILEYMKQVGGAPSEWCGGITSDPNKRIFTDHAVRQNGDAWIYEPASTAQIAREVETYLLNTVGAAGGTGGGDNTSRVVYAYRMTANTKP